MNDGGSRDRWPSGNTARFTANGGKDNRGWIPWIDFETEARREIVEKAGVVRPANRASPLCVSLQDCRCRSPRGLAVPRRAAKRRGWTLNRAGQRVGHAKIFSDTALLTYLLTYLHLQGSGDFLRLTAKSIPRWGTVKFFTLTSALFQGAHASISTSSSSSFHHFFLSLIRSTLSWLEYFLFPFSLSLGLVCLVVLLFFSSSSFFVVITPIRCFRTVWWFSWKVVSSDFTLQKRSLKRFNL